MPQQEKHSCPNWIAVQSALNRMRPMMAPGHPVSQQVLGSRAPCLAPLTCTRAASLSLSASTLAVSAFALAAAASASAARFTARSRSLLH